MASLQKIKRKNGVAFRIRYQLRGKEHVKYLPIGASKTLAESILAEYNNRLARDKLQVEVFQDPLEKSSSDTISTFRDLLLENKKTAIRKGRPVADRTLESYIRAFDVLINCIGDIPISSIDSRISDIEGV